MKRSIVLLLIITGVLGVGCKNRVVFTTHSSLGLDVSGTAQLPNKVSFSYNRFEAALVPRKTNGESHSVFGGMDADVSFFGGHTIKQTFATGEAAMLATKADTNGVNTSTEDPAKDPLVFLTSTTFGLHLTAGEQEMSPNMLLGYRRSEGTVIPVPDSGQEVRSVYADILINSSKNTNSSAITTNFSTLKGVRIKQSFATGRAAKALAKGAQMQAKLEEATGIAATKETLISLNQQARTKANEIKAELDRLKSSEAGLKSALTKFRSVKFLGDRDLADTSLTLDQLRRGMEGAIDRQSSGSTTDRVTVDRMDQLLAELKKIST